MDPKTLKKFLLPAAGVAAVIVVLALLSQIKPGTGSGSGSSDSGQAMPKAGRSHDTSDVGMVDAMPADFTEWKDLGSGLRIQDVKEGSGETVNKIQDVTAHYSGWRASDGFLFDSSRSRGQAITFNLQGVVKGWTQGIPGMKAGGIRRLYIPAALGYGMQGSAPNIPPNADLIFEVKLIAFE